MLPLATSYRKATYLLGIDMNQKPYGSGCGLFDGLVRKAVIPAAGLGTRLLSATKELPKEMLPVFSFNTNGKRCMKPLLECVFEQLYDVGLREFCFVIGRGKRAIEDHFTPDCGYLRFLRERGVNTANLEEFYDKLSNSTIIWANQPEPKGFGDAVLKAQRLVGEETFIVNAGDTLIISRNGLHFDRLVENHRLLQAHATFIVHEVKNPSQHGIVNIADKHGDAYSVKLAIEKPDCPPSNLAIIPIYVFHPIVFEALAQIKPGKGGEVQLTDAIQTLIDWKKKVYAIKLQPGEIRFDVGTPETYWEALSLSFQENRGTYYL